MLTSFTRRKLSFLLEIFHNYVSSVATLWPVLLCDVTGDSDPSWQGSRWWLISDHYWMETDLSEHDLAASLKSKSVSAPDMAAIVPGSYRSHIIDCWWSLTAVTPYGVFLLPARTPGSYKLIHTKLTVARTAINNAPCVPFS